MIMYAYYYSSISKYLLRARTTRLRARRVVVVVVVVVVSVASLVLGPLTRVHTE